MPAITSPSPLDPAVQAVVARVPLWSGAQQIHVAPLQDGVISLNNANYRVAVEGADYVLRIAADTAGLLGVRREEEREVATAAAQAGLSPEVLFFDPQHGHMVTPFIQGRHWRPEEFRDQTNIARLAQTLRQLHAIKQVQTQGSVFGRVERLLDSARALGVLLPGNLDVHRDRLRQLDERRRADTHFDPGLGHNDLWANNFLDDGQRLWLLDWEFGGGNADGLYDLATVALAGQYTPEQQASLLHQYYSSDTAPTDRQRCLQDALHWLQAMKYAVRFFEACWALVQHGLRGSSGFDYLGYAQRTLEAITREDQ